MEVVVFHIADLHIKNNRRDEYSDVFGKFVEKVRMDPAEKKIAVIAGDIFDNKTTISSVNMLDYHDFLSKLSKECVVITIMGNHDVNLNNPESVDLVYPFSSMMNRPNIHHYCKSGSYWHENLVFNVQSPNDPVNLMHVENAFNILIFHENLAGVSFNGGTLKGRFSIEDVKKYDVVIGGHIHEYTKIGENGAYSGSLIQQNKGESVTKGYVKWTVKKTGVDETFKASSEFCPIENPKGFLKYVITGTEVKPNIIEGYQNHVSAPHSIVIEVDNADKITYEQTVRTLQNQFKIETSVKNRNIVKVETENLDDMKEQSRLLSDMLDEKKVDVEIKKEILEMHKTYERKQNSFMPWEILKIEWSNLYCYGDGNVVDFSQIKENVVGLIAKNKSGKSAFVDILVYALFNRTIRGDRLNLINKHQKNGYVKLQIKIGDDLHEIYRHLDSKSNNITHTINGENKTGKDVVETYKNIENLIGGFDDFISTIIMTQDKQGDYLFMSANDQAEFLSKLLNLDALKTCHIHVKDTIKVCESQIRHVSNRSSAEMKTDLELLIEQLFALKQELKESEEFIEKNIGMAPIKPKMSSKQLLTQISNMEKEFDELDLDDESVDELNTQFINMCKNMPSKPTLDEEKCAGRNIEYLVSDTWNKKDRDLAVLAMKIKKYREYRKFEVPKTEFDACKSVYLDYLNQLDELKVDQSAFQHTQYHGFANSKADIEDDLNIWTQIAELEKKVNSSRSIGRIKKDMRSIGYTLDELNGMITQAQSIIGSSIQQSLRYDQTCESCQHNQQIIEKHAHLNEFVNSNEKYDLSEIIDKKIKLVELQDEFKKATQNDDLTKKIDELKCSLKTALDIAVLKHIFTHFDEILEEYRLEKSISQLKKQCDVAKIIYFTHKYYAYFALYHELAVEKVHLYDTHKEKVDALDRKMNIYKKRDELIVRIKKTKGLYHDCAYQERVYERDWPIFMEVENRRKCLRGLIERIATLKKERNHLRSNIEIEAQNEHLRKKKHVLEIYLKCLDTKTGIPIRILEKASVNISNYANNIINQLSDFGIRFKLMGTRLNMYIVENDKEIPADMGSGFQKFIISLALRSAFSYLSQRSRVKMLVIDEGFGCLDDENLAKMVEVIPTFKEWYNHILIITHLDVIKNSIEYPLLVTRVVDNGITYSALNYGKYTIPSKKKVVKSIRESDIMVEVNGKYQCNVCMETYEKRSKNRHFTSKSHMQKLKKFQIIPSESEQKND